MANYRTFHSQLTSIMETLTRAAMAEICELVDDGYAVLHLEISRHQKENEELRQKLQLIESIIARGAGGGPATEKIIAARDSRGRDGLGRGKLVIVEEYTSRDVEESQPITVQVKQEEPEQHGTGEDGEGADVTQDSLGEDVEEVLTDMAAHRAHTHTHTHTHTRADSLDTHTHSRADSQDTHTHSALEVSSAILLESDEDNTLADSTLDSHTHSEAHTDSDTHTHSDAFSDIQHTPCEAADAQDTHTHTHTHAHAQALSFLDRVCVKREGGASSGVCELVADWRSRSANARHALAHTHTHTLSHTHTHTHGLPSSGLGAAHPALFSLLPHAHTHTHTHTHGQPLRSSGGGGGGGGGGGVCKRSFICAFCGKSFTTAQSLDTHTRIHTGERPFRCGQCGKRFTQSGHLSAHQTVHTGERPHPCTHCSKRFAGKQYLRIHMRKHHPEQHTHT
ncbi:zinc finger protein 585B [Sardina pilchardus]|uniref:zinc finger protein 585B n=1 Tax=Sardina pilchardus TaxID=27697 RepID=UPI002E140DEF